MNPYKIHPQTYAEIISKNINSIAKNACCAFVCMWAVGVTPEDNAEWIKIVSDAIDAKVLGTDCLVYWQPFIKWLTGRNVKVTAKTITSLKEIISPTPVLFKQGKNQHWAGVENGKVVFNSLEYSNCVTNGKPVECRIIELV